MRDVIGYPLNAFPKVPFFEIVLRNCPGPDDDVRDANVCSAGNLSTCWQHPDAYYRRRCKTLQTCFVTSGEVLRGPQSHVASRYGAACRMCQGRHYRRASRSQWGRVWRIVVGAATSDTAHRPARLEGLAHFVSCTNPRRVAQPMDEAAHTYIDAHLGHQGLWRRGGNIKRLSFRRQPHTNEVHTVMLFFFR